MKHNLDEFSSTLLLCTLSLSKYSCVSTALHTHTRFWRCCRGSKESSSSHKGQHSPLLPCLLTLSKQTWHSGMQPCVIQNAFPVRQICKAKSLLLSPRTEFNHSQHRNCEGQNNFVGRVASVLSYMTSTSSARTFFCTSVTQGLGMTWKILDKLLPVKHE